MEHMFGTCTLRVGIEELTPAPCKSLVGTLARFALCRLARLAAGRSDVLTLYDDS